MLFFTLWHSRCYFFPLIFTQGRENDKQTHMCAHTHTLLVRRGESDCSSHPRSPWIPVVLIWLVWLGFMFTVNQNAQQTQGRSIPLADPAVETEQCVSIQINFTPRWWSDDRALHWTFIQHFFFQMHCCSILVFLFISIVLRFWINFYFQFSFYFY